MLHICYNICNNVDGGRHLCKGRFFMVLKCKKLGKTCLSILLAVVCLMTSLLFFQINAKADNIVRIGIVEVVGNLNFRSDAGTENPVIGYLSNGQTGVIHAEKKASNGVLWYQMTVNGTTGWASSNYVRVTEQVIKEDKEFTAYLVAQGFPESYHASLQALHAKYPNWVFQAQHTNLTWTEVINAESVLGKNLVHAGAATSWKSMQNGAYNWETSTWKVFDSGGWVAASTEVIKHFMDPRNFLDETNIFQFLRQSYNANEYTEEGLAEIKAGLTKMVKNTFLAGNCDNVPYIDVIMQVAAEKGVSPYVLASMMIQEMGTEGKSNSMSGTLPGYEGYYNYFNVAAFATDTLTAIQKGLLYAKGSGSYGRPWNTRYKSIAGGAEYYAEGYVKKGQDTMYLKKFNVQGSNPYTHQYMTNVQGAASEGKHMAKAYDENARQGSLTFKIPVYKNMPTIPAIKPADNRNPNYMLKALGVTNYSLTPTFNMHETNYSLIVPYETKSITITASAIASVTKITGAGAKELKVGTNTFAITSTAENETKKVYNITVVRQEGEEPTPPSGDVEAPSISSTECKVNDDNTITGVKTFPIKASDFATKISVSNGSVKITNSNGTVKTSNVGTGDQVRVYDEQGALQYTYNVVIYGDTNGDGTITALDLLRAQKDILAISKLNGLYNSAADTNKDGKITALDLLQMQKHILKIKSIAQ